MVKEVYVDIKLPTDKLSWTVYCQLHYIGNYISQTFLYSMVPSWSWQKLQWWVLAGVRKVAPLCYDRCGLEAGRFKMQFPDDSSFSLLLPWPHSSLPYEFLPHLPLTSGPHPTHRWKLKHGHHVKLTIHHQHQAPFKVHSSKRCAHSSKCSYSPVPELVSNFSSNLQQFLCLYLPSSS